MTPRRYGPLAYVPINRRPPLAWPSGARVALWVNPNVEFFGLDDVMPSNLNDRVPRDQAKIPNVRNWAVRDYGNRIGIWRLMEVLSRYGIRASAALNSEVCDHHREIIEEGGKLGWEWIGHNQTNTLRLTEMDPAIERAAIRATIDRIEAASGTRPVGWLGAGLAETWNTLDYLAEAGIRYVCDWVNDDQPYLFEIGTPPLVSLPYSVQTNDVPAYFERRCRCPNSRRC
ncbi:MAG: polysaccharide deacetylase family protein [Stellaceae bacterium]